MWQSRQLKGCVKLQASRLHKQAQRQPDGPQRQLNGPQRQPKGSSGSAQVQLIHAACLHL